LETPNVQSFLSHNGEGIKPSAHKDFIKHTVIHGGIDNKEEWSEIGAVIWKTGW